jgi:hypothetical protein
MPRVASSIAITNARHRRAKRKGGEAAVRHFSRKKETHTYGLRFNADAGGALPDKASKGEE